MPEDTSAVVNVALNVARAAHMRHLVETVRQLEDKLREGGGAQRIEKQHRAGKLTARERIAPCSIPRPASSKSVCSIAYDQYDGKPPRPASSRASARSKAAPPSSSPTTPP